ncbi:DUF1289 domain-containing protein [Vibrio metoecus]|uniref:DUF1289 domain-containing protein n=1 Tax=Vibrio metoecus TaxID=1481663 RepID=UPI0006D850E2|nr:DUF1289 domain-containing protein [Vibrio metoecus]KQA18894.1 Fe-S oxidoreductase [Vibrio metoecus]PAR40177.1 DUF1289 domain-containing protein [Vibrio metoecus]
MEQLEFFNIVSPCVGVCSVDEKGYCKGCLRKREERFGWLSMTPAQQLHVIKLCRQRYRRKQAEARGKKQTESLSENEPLTTDAQPTLF